MQYSDITVMRNKVTNETEKEKRKPGAYDIIPSNPSKNVFQDDGLINVLIKLPKIQLR